MKKSGRRKAENGRSKLRTERAFYLDVLRLVALFLSVFAYMGGREAGPLVSTLTTTGPVLFFMASGAALLGYEEDLHTIWRERILPAIIGLLFFSFLYFLLDVRLGRDQFDLTVFFADFYGLDRIQAFGYVYAYIGFLISLPFLRAIARNIKERDFIYLLVIAFVVQTALPLLDDMYFMRRYELNQSLRLSWTVNTIFLFPLAGYYIHNCLTREQMKRLVGILWVVALAWTFLVVYRTHYYTTYVASGALYHEYEKQAYLPLGMAICVTLRLLLGEAEEKPIVRELARCGSGAYLMQGIFYMHIAPIETVRLALMHETIGRAMIPPLLVWTLLTCLLLIALTALLRRIPGVRRIFDYE